MKKTILLLLVLLTASQVFAGFTESREWRWRRNDGSQTTATYIAPQNTTITINDKSIIRLRLNVTNPSDDNRFHNTRLYYSKNSSGTFTTYLDSVGTNGAPFRLAAISTPVTDREVTTGQLTNTSTDATIFTPGKLYTRTDNDSVLINGKRYTEVEWAISPTSTLEPSTTYYFRLNGIDPANSFTLPTLTTAAVLPVSLSAFNGKTEGSINKLNWQTASEQNCDRFEVEYSTDGKDWTKIAVVKGSGTTQAKTDYSATHTTPVKGNNYYRLKQVDLDCKSNYSAVINVKLNGSSAVGLQIYPNPAHQDIFFTISNPVDKVVTAVVYDVQGKILLSKTITTQPGTTTYKMEGNSKLVKGTYILKLNGQQTAESALVNVE